MNTHPFLSRKFPMAHSTEQLENLARQLQEYIKTIDLNESIDSFISKHPFRFVHQLLVDIGNAEEVVKRAALWEEKVEAVEMDLRHAKELRRDWREQYALLLEASKGWKGQ